MATKPVLNIIGEHPISGADIIKQDHNQNYNLINDYAGSIQGDFNSHVSGATARHKALDVTFTPVTNITAIETQSAIEQVNTRVGNIIASSGTSSTEVVDARLSSTFGAFANVKTRADNTDIKLKELIDIAGAFGIRWNETDDVWTRLGQSTSNTDWSKVYPFSEIKRCNLSDLGVVNAYFGDPTYIENGTNGQTMVEYPETYSKYLYYTLSTKVYHEWWISSIPRAGFELDPAFVYDTGTSKKFYLSAYEASIFDVSASAYLLADEQVADFTVTTGDKLASIISAKPCSGLTQDLTLPKSRILANNRGLNWQLWNGTQIAFVQKLLMIEYGNANSQTAIGLGVVSKVTGTVNESEITGATSFLGNLSGRQAGTDGLTSVSYRGLENMWGNIFGWVDGINIQANNVLWINPTNKNHISDSYVAPYLLQGTLSNVNGFVSKLLGNKYGMFAVQNVGSSSTRIPDFYAQSAGNRVAVLGGIWTDGSDAGFACWHLSNSSANRNRLIGARFCYQF